MGHSEEHVRPVDIQVIEFNKKSSKAKVSYRATYADGVQKNVRVEVSALHRYSFYRAEGLIVVKSQCLGKVRIGFLGREVRYVFLIKLNDRTVDIVQAKKGTHNYKRLVEIELAGEDDESLYLPDLIEVTDENTAADDEDAPAIKTPRAYLNGTRIEEIEIPIEILPNLYSVNLSNISLKYHVTRAKGKVESDYVTLKCKVNYALNGRPEGKRGFTFVSYGENDEMLDKRGDDELYQFTDAGHEFISVTFDGYAINPIKKISISVREA